MKFIKIAAVLVLVFMVLSAAVLWSWGKFARRVMGEPSMTLQVQLDQTALDRWASPMLAAHPDQTGVSLISDNLKAFAVRALTARQAERSLDVQYYIWKDDLTGRMLKEELLKAAERGVRVRMLLDDMNGLTLDKSLMQLASHQNIEVRLFNPARNRDTVVMRSVEMVLRVFSFNRRMHNKTWIADGRLAVVGGRNIGNEYFNAADVNFHDADLVLIGPGAEQSSTVFDDFWNSNAVIPLTAMHGGLDEADRAAFVRERTAWREEAKNTPYLQAIGDKMNDPQALFGELRHHWVSDLRVLSDPPAKAAPIEMDRAPERWLMFDVLQSLFSARESMRVVSPYFVPGTTGTLLFSGMAARGVDVGIMSNSLAANDVPAVHAGYAKYRKPLLEAGVSLWEMKPGDRSGEKSGLKDSGILGSSGASLHTKAFIIDETRGFVGSFNFDPRSASLNTEMGVWFEHEALARDVLAVFEGVKDPSTSYKLGLENGELRWHDELKNKVWTTEPETTWPKRAFAYVLSWLPIESQL